VPTTRETYSLIQTILQFSPFLSTRKIGPIIARSLYLQLLRHLPEHNSWQGLIAAWYWLTWALFHLSPGPRVAVVLKNQHFSTELDHGSACTGRCRVYMQPAYRMSLCGKFLAPYWTPPRRPLPSPLHQGRP